MNRPRLSLLAPLLAVLALLLGLVQSASAAFNHAATEPLYGNFLLHQSEASAQMPLETADPTREFGVWLYDSASGVPVYVNQNPWTAFDPEGLWMQPVGDWLADKFGAPPAPVAFMARHSDKVTGTVHAINAGVSFVPGLGKLADGLDATISSAEGDYKGAALTAGGGKAAHLASNAMHATAGLLLAAKIASHGDDVANVVKATEKTAEIAADLSKSARTVAKEGAEAAEKEVATVATKPPHGNTLDDRPATLYEKYDKEGNFQKHGITKHEDPAKRYTKKQIDGGEVRPIERGPRSEMVKKERGRVETKPGPDNREPWAGKRSRE